MYRISTYSLKSDKVPVPYPQLDKQNTIYLTTHFQVILLFTEPDYIKNCDVGFEVLSAVVIKRVLLPSRI
jgi:hypothetical protein